MKHLIVVLLSSLSLAALPAHAEEDKRTPAEAFRGDTYFHLTHCKLKERIAQSTAENDPATYVREVATCTKEGKAGVKKQFPRVLKTVAKNKEATKLLKDYYGAWLTAIDGIIPNPSESRIDHARRMEAIDANLEGIWNRFEVEAAAN